MDKRKLSAVEREEADLDMVNAVRDLRGIEYIVTAKLICENKILLMHFFKTANLKKGNTKAAFRTFLSSDDYITQDLGTSKVKWKTASFNSMSNFNLYDSGWSGKKWVRRNLIHMDMEELKIISNFFKDFSKPNDESVWDAINRFQADVMKKRLEVRHRKETEPIDRLMETVHEVPDKFIDWMRTEVMSFSRYLVYSSIDKHHAKCECTHCKGKTVIDRREIRLRNNEKSICPVCGSKVTIKASGKLPHKISDERWAVYIDRTENGFIWRYFHIFREIMRDSIPNVKDWWREYSRAFYTFENGKPHSDSYEFAEFKQSGTTRWCHDEGKIMCGLCTLYPENLPQAWEHTPMKYSALEILSQNNPSRSIHYEYAIRRYIDFPQLEWLCKMGLSELAEHVIDEGVNVYGSRLNKNGKTIYQILQINKVNTRILQSIDGNSDTLRLLQVAEKSGLSLKPEQLKEYYETFGCNTDLLRQAKRKVSLHKLVKYIAKESERYPIGERGACCRYSYMRYYEREDPRIERKQNAAHDWLEYLKWCKELGYDLNNMFIYMPNNFKKVHDRTANEYQELQDKKAAAEKRKRELEAQKAMERTRRAMEEIFKRNQGVDAFSIKGKGLILVVPRNADDIRAEGTALHHCVGGYVERVAKGETLILFVRQADEPDKPYFTLEWRNGKVIQCRGMRNCAMTTSIKAFVKVFEEKMLEAEGKKDQNRKVG